jgi:hypothetical protein
VNHDSIKGSSTHDDLLVLLFLELHVIVYKIGYVSLPAKFTLLLQYLQSTLPLFWIANKCKEIMKKVNKGFKSNSLDIIFKLELKLQGNKKEE